MCHAGDFKAQLGDQNNPGLLTQEQRLAALQLGQNPYVTGPALPGNSPVFFGRAQLLHGILGNLRKPDRPGSVSVLGERRIGKSSLLNQIFTALAQEPGLVCIHATAQNWNQSSQQAFYAALQQSISNAVGLAAYAPVPDYPAFRDFIGELARQYGYRFVLIIDEFEVMAGNPNFDTTFFFNLRALADSPGYRFGYLVSSRRPLKDLCREHKIDASSFWNIFGAVHRVGLLEPAEAQALLSLPFQRTLPQATCPSAEVIFPLTGCHPLLLQLAANHYWIAVDGGFTLADDDESLVLAIRNYLEDFWFQRNREQLSLLIRAAAGCELKPSPQLMELTQHGLLVKDPDNGRYSPFCKEFRRVIEENMPPGKSVAQAAEDLAQGAEKATKLFDRMVKLAAAGGKLYRAFKELSNGGGESGL